MIARIVVFTARPLSAAWHLDRKGGPAGSRAEVTKRRIRPKQGQLGSCLTNTRAVSGSQASNHRNPILPPAGRSSSNADALPILVSGPDEFESAFAAMAKAGAQAVIIQGFFDPHRAILVELAIKQRLALMSGSRETTAAGGVISISANYLALYERAAHRRSARAVIVRAWACACRR
jgi:hypothetical protein